MALTRDILRANTALSALSDEQVAAIEELSKNDENTVIGNRIGELHRQYDKDVLEVTGISKQQDEKSFNFVKRVLTDYKTKAEGYDGLNKKVSDLQKEIEGYKKTIAEGKGSEAIAQQLKDAQKQLADTKQLYDVDKKSWEERYNNLNSQYQNSLIDGEFTKALQGIKFKSIYPESVQKTLIESAKRSVLSTGKADWVEDNGTKKLVFRDSAGNIMTNPENKLNPFTAGELLTRELKDVIETGRRQTGAGTGSGSPTGAGNNAIDLSGVTSQVEADEKIAKHLMALGYTRGSKEFADEALKIRKENGVDKMKME